MLRILLTLTTQLILVAAPANVFSQERGDVRQSDASEARATRGRRGGPRMQFNPVVIQLRHADCVDVARLIEYLAPQSASHPDVRTNCIVYSGPDDTIEAVRKLINELDRPVEESHSLDIAMISVQHRNANELAKQISKMLGGSRQSQMRVSADETRSAVLLNGSKPMVESARAILKQLDTPAGSANIEFAFFHAYQDKDQDNLEATIPPDLTEIAKELKRFGALELLGRLSIVAVEHERFNVEGCIAQDLSAVVKGKLARVGDDDTVTLLLEAFVRLEKAQKARPTNDEGKAMRRGLSPTFQLETAIQTRRGDYVGLGSAPSGWSSGESIILVLHVRQ